MRKAGWEDTARFYRDVIGLPEVPREEESDPPITGFLYGANHLWIDRVDTLSQAELWLEVSTDDVPAASDYLRSVGVVRRDEIEPLGEGFNGFWIANPAAIIHMVRTPDAW